MRDVKLGHSVVIPQPDLVNLYGCAIGDATRIGAFVEVQKNSIVGSRCKISSHTFICEGVTIEPNAMLKCQSARSPRYHKRCWFI